MRKAGRLCDGSLASVPITELSEASSKVIIISVEGLSSSLLAKLSHLFLGVNATPSATPYC